MLVKSAVISAWAELQVNSKEQQYLVEVVSPHIPVLAPLWLSSLKEFARLRFGPDESLENTPSPLQDDVDIKTGSVVRQTLLGVSFNLWLWELFLFLTSKSFL
jgi:hypothetical protein